MTTTSTTSTQDRVLHYLVTDEVEVSAQEIAEDLGVSVSTARKALKALVADGKAGRNPGGFHDSPATFFAAEVRV